MRLGILTLRPWVCLRPLSRNRMSGIEHTSLRPLVADEGNSRRSASLGSVSAILTVLHCTAPISQEFQRIFCCP
jgi:hypothetical protein